MGAYGASIDRGNEYPLIVVKFNVANISRYGGEYGICTSVLREAGVMMCTHSRIMELEVGVGETSRCVNRFLPPRLVEVGRVSLG